MKKGGYQILDLKGQTSGSTIDGIYELLEGNTKPVLVSGLVDGGVEYRDAFVEFTVSESNFVGIVYGKTITITSLNVFTIA